MIFFKKKLLLWSIIAVAIFIAIVFVTAEIVVSMSKKVFINDISPIAKIIRLQNQYIDKLRPKQVRYLIHDGFYYVPTEEMIKKDKLDKLLGQVTRVNRSFILQDGDTNMYIPTTKYYSIKGISEQEKIASENGMNTKTIKESSDYIVLERYELVEKGNEEYIFSEKGDLDSVNIALKNLRMHIPFLYEFTANDLKPFLVDVSDDKPVGDIKIPANRNNNGRIFIVFTPKQVENINEPTKWIYLRIYENGFKPKYMEEFEHSPEPILSSFDLNDIHWDEYKNKDNAYFKGTKNNIIYEVSSTYFSSDQIKQYLNSFLSTATK